MSWFQIIVDQNIFQAIGIFSVVFNLMAGKVFGIFEV